MIRRLKKLNRKTLLLGAAILLFLVLASSGWVYWHKSSQPTITSGDDLSPAAAADKQEIADRKNQIVQDQKNQTSLQNSGTKNISVIITEASATDVRGYANGVFEDGGICTATATYGSQTFSRTSTGFGNVSYTQCAPINWNPPLSRGTWTVNLSYKSAMASGSVNQTIEVR